MGALWVPCAPITSAHTMRTNYYQAPDNALGIGGRGQQHSILDTLPLTLVTWHLLMGSPPLVRAWSLKTRKQGHLCNPESESKANHPIIHLIYVRRERRRGKEEEDPLRWLPAFTCLKSASLDPRTSYDIANKVVTSRGGRGTTHCDVFICLISA